MLFYVLLLVACFLHFQDIFLKICENVHSCRLHTFLCKKYLQNTTGGLIQHLGLIRKVNRKLLTLFLSGLSQSFWKLSKFLEANYNLLQNIFGKSKKKQNGSRCIDACLFLCSFLKTSAKHSFMKERLSSRLCSHLIYRFS